MSKVLTLLYHRINTLSKDVNLLAVTPEHFYEQMRWVKSRYPIVRFEDNWDLLSEDSICITFDDGYRDNFLNAIPILNELEIPATIFVSTGNIDTPNEMWWDELERNLLIEKDYKKEFRLQDPLWGCSWNVSTTERRLDLYYTLHWIMKNFLTIESRNNWIMQLERWNGFTNIGRPVNFSLQTEDLVNLDLRNITIGAHTVNHASLSKLGREKQYEEILVSKRRLEEIFKKEIQVFSYPFGGKDDYNADTISICSELGFVKAAANVKGIWNEVTNKYEIPRCIVRNWKLEEYKKNIDLFWKGSQV